jgi:transcription elongation factor GreA
LPPEQGPEKGEARKSPVLRDAWQRFYPFNGEAATAAWAYAILKIMLGEQIFISRKGYQKMLAEVDELKSRKPKIALAIKEALEKGDLKENAEYHAAKEELSHVQRRIADLENKLGSARLLEDQANIPSDKAYIGATVTVKDPDGVETNYTLVDATEANAAEGRISVTSPIGQSLLGQPVDAKVKVPVGKNGYILHILKITRE